MKPTASSSLEDLDPSLLYSETYPLDELEESELLLLIAAEQQAQAEPGHSEYPEEEEFGFAEARDDQDEFEDDLEAVELVKQEQKEQWDREGKVIRGNRLALGKGDLGLVIAGDNIKRKIRRERNQHKYLSARKKLEFGGGWRSSSLPPGE